MHATDNLESLSEKSMQRAQLHKLYLKVHAQHVQHVQALVIAAVECETLQCECMHQMT